MSNVLYVFSFVALMATIVIFGSSDVEEHPIIYNSIEHAVIDNVEINDEVVFSEENFKMALIEFNIKNPDIVYRQAYLETGGFTSNIFLENNNLFGMKLPYIRNTTAIGSQFGHAEYDNWIDSVEDMFLYQDYFSADIEDSYNYYDFLEGRYAEDVNYCDKLKDLY